MDPEGEEENEDDLEPYERFAVAESAKLLQNIGHLKAKRKAHLDSDDQNASTNAVDGLDVEGRKGRGVGRDLESGEANYLVLDADIMRQRLFEYIIGPELDKRLRNALEEV